MNTIEKSATRWFRFGQFGSIITLCILVIAGIQTLRILASEGAKFPVIALAGGLLFVAIQLWAIFFLLLMMCLDPKRRVA